MEAATPCLIYSTHPSPEQARATAASLVDGGLAACCNLLPASESHYLWEGKRQTTQETILLSKTTLAQAEAATQAIRAQHPYDCPCILQLPVSGGHGPFLNWLQAACTAQ